MSYGWHEDMPQGESWTSWERDPLLCRDTHLCSGTVLAMWEWWQLRVFLDPSGNAAIPGIAPACLLKNGLNES